VKNPHRFTSPREARKLFAGDSTPTPEQFTAKPWAHGNEVAQGWSRGLQVILRKTHRARRNHALDIAGPLGTDHAWIVVFSALLEEIRHAEERQKDAKWAADFCTRKADESLLTGDLERAERHLEEGRQALAHYDELEREIDALVSEGRALLDRFPNPDTPALRAVLRAFEEISKGVGPEWQAAEEIEPRTRPPRTRSTFAHAPPTTSGTFTTVSPGRGVALTHNYPQERQF